MPSFRLTGRAVLFCQIKKKQHENKKTKKQNKCYRKTDLIPVALNVWIALSISFYPSQFILMILAPNHLNDRFGQVHIPYITPPAFGSLSRALAWLDCSCRIFYFDEILHICNYRCYEVLMIHFKSDLRNPQEAANRI